jgi:hypothetical protein
MIFYYQDKDTPIGQPSDQLQLEYRGFKITKRPGYELYSIVAPSGKLMHKQLEGDFSNQRILRDQIDGFLANHETIEDAFILPEPPKPKRGRPPTGNQQEELKEETQQT